MQILHFRGFSLYFQSIIRIWALFLQNCAANVKIREFLLNCA